MLTSSTPQAQSANTLPWARTNDAYQNASLRDVLDASQQDAEVSTWGLLSKLSMLQ